MDIAQQIPDQYSIISELNTRIRILEGKYNLTRERMLLINQNMIDHYKDLNNEIKTLNIEIKEMKETLEVIKETNINIVKELSFFARKDQLKILEKYINMWNPLNFITEEEVLELMKKNKEKNVTKRKRK